MNTIKNTLVALALSAGLTSSALAAGGGGHTLDHDFSFDGPLGVYDQGELQRGLQVYQGVCAACHGMKYVAFRTLAEENGPGLTPAQVKAFIAEAGYEVQDEEGEPGEPRPAKTYDYFPANTSADAPDMSLLAKARPGGAAHIYSIMVGYEEAPACAPDDMDGAYNKAFGSGGIPDECKDDHGHSTIEGSWIGMASPLETADLEYADGTQVTMEQMAHDVSAFLMWAAEPKLVERKQAGLRNILFLVIFAVLLYFVNRRLWSKVKHPE